jgi:hypothetical protein
MIFASEISKINKLESGVEDNKPLSGEAGFRALKPILRGHRR